MGSTALCVYSVSVARTDTDDLEQDETLADVLSDIGKMSKEIEHINGVKDVLTRRLTSEFSKDIGAIDDLHAEIAELELQLEEWLEDDEDVEEGAEKAEWEDLEDDPFVDAADNIDFQEIDDEQLAFEGNAKLCKRVYLSIAKRCHPDKTRVPRLRELFIKAAHALGAMDLDELEDIHFMAYGAYFGKKDTRESLIQRLVNAKLRRDALAKELFALKNTDDYKLVVTYETHGYGVASKAYKAALSLTKSALKAQVEALRTTYKAYSSFMAM